MPRFLAWPGRPTRLVSILAWATCLPAAPALAAGLPPARDLPAEAGEAADSGQPLVVMFSRRDCSWCEQVRRLHLAPLAREKAGPVPVRQVDIDRGTPLVDPQGRATTHRAYARGAGVRLVPTVFFLGPDGRQVAEPIVGAVGSDFYGAYLERGIEQGRRRVAEDRK
ncbi:MAG: hypothetical protein JNK22_06560 [Rhodocyclaceae bacterium]|nr:hypothetical protein [Rhodocyclaceae bacterium]